MEKRYFKVNNKTVVRVQKRTAEKFYNNGKDVIIAPCFSNLQSPFVSYNILWKGNKVFTDFTNAVNCYVYYNCCYDETGKYPAFYVYEDDMK